jgi:hypothetical protein
MVEGIAAVWPVDGDERDVVPDLGVKHGGKLPDTPRSPHRRADPDQKDGAV